MRSVLLRRFKWFLSLSLSTCDDGCGFKLLCWCAWWNDWWLKKMWAGCLSHGNPYAVNFKCRDLINNRLRNWGTSHGCICYLNDVAVVATCNPWQNFVTIESTEQCQLGLWWHCVAPDSGTATMRSSAVNSLHLIASMNAHSSAVWDIGGRHLLRLQRQQQQRPASMVGSAAGSDFPKHLILLFLQFFFCERIPWGWMWMNFRTYLSKLTLWRWLRLLMRRWMWMRICIQYAIAMVARLCCCGACSVRCRNTRCGRWHRWDETLSSSTIEHRFHIFPCKNNFIGWNATQFHVSAPWIEVGRIRLNVFIAGTDAMRMEYEFIWRKE